MLNFIKLYWFLSNFVIYCWIQCIMFNSVSHNLILNLQCPEGAYLGICPESLHFFLRGGGISPIGASKTWNPKILMTQGGRSLNCPPPSICLFIFIPRKTVGFTVAECSVKTWIKYTLLYRQEYFLAELGWEWVYRHPDRLSASLFQ